jgi:hypothetical protein
MQGRRKVYFFSTNATRSSCSSGKSFVRNRGPNPSNVQQTADGSFTGDSNIAFLFKVLFFYELQINTTIQFMERVIQNKKKTTTY